MTTTALQEQQPSAATIEFAAVVLRDTPVESRGQQMQMQ
jgi:hypothetical protein